jgi:hypothetical protein
MDSLDGRVAVRSPVDEVVSQIGGDTATALSCQPYGDGERDETGGKRGEGRNRG